MEAKKKEKKKSCPQEMAQNAVQIIHIILCECSPKDTSGCCSRSLDCHKHPSGRLWAWTKSFGVLNWMGSGKCAECASALGFGSNYHEMLLCSLCVVMESRVYLGKTAAFREPFFFNWVQMYSVIRLNPALSQHITLIYSPTSKLSDIYDTVFVTFL